MFASARGSAEVRVGVMVVMMVFTFCGLVVVEVVMMVVLTCSSSIVVEVIMLVMFMIQQ